MTESAAEKESQRRLRETLLKSRAFKKWLIPIAILIVMPLTAYPVLFSTTRDTTWTISPYPDGHNFAFTIVHDADDAYSGRLRPLFDIFDELGFKLTVTTFVFWPPGEGSPPGGERTRGLPLEEQREREFYLELSQRGHEIGMHTPSDGDDTREDVVRAFEYFREVFGYYPKVYVEHRANRENQERQGSDPASAYYITDLLNSYGPWVWTVSPSSIPYEGGGDYFNILGSSQPFLGSATLKAWGIIKKLITTGKWRERNGDDYLLAIANGSPFDRYARQKFGLIKAFRRSGRNKDSHGTGFLKGYSTRNFDTLERDRGIALVYTHLNSSWLDKETKRMRPEIVERLRYIAEKDVWLAQAGVILDRYRDMQMVSVSYDDRWVKVINAGRRTVEGVTLLSGEGYDLSCEGRKLERNEAGEIVIGDVGPRQTLTLEVVQ